MAQAITEVTLGGRQPDKKGKVRRMFDVRLPDGQPGLLIVATDNISAYDVVMPNPIPDKGRLLTGMTLFWLELLKGIVPNHLITADVDMMAGDGVIPASDVEALRGRAMLCRKAEPLPVEAVVRGYLAGSAWKEYKEYGTICGRKAMPGLVQCAMLGALIFTPATKAEGGHDENISYERMAQILTEKSGADGPKVAILVYQKSLALYTAAYKHALGTKDANGKYNGIIIADTKFEFGRLPDGSIILIDEVLTPDSSRFWPADDYKSGHDQPSFDKQFLRNWLDSGEKPWNRQPPAPELPPDIVERTRAKYVEAFERLTGKRFE